MRALSPAVFAAAAAQKAEAEKATPSDATDDVVYELYHQHKILSRAEYPKIRKTFAERFEAAIDTLAAGVSVDANDARVVPKMLDKLEPLCQNERGGRDYLVGLYQRILPTIKPLDTKDRPNPISMQMYKRGIQCFQGAGLRDLAQKYETQLRALETARSTSK